MISNSKKTWKLGILSVMNASKKAEKVILWELISVAMLIWLGWESTFRTTTEKCTFSIFDL